MLKRLALFSASLMMLAVAASLAVRLTPTLNAATQMAAPTEVATLSGVLADGQTIPLPVYADGTTALESECSWTVSLGHIGSGPPDGGQGFWREEECSTNGRIVRCRAFSYSPPSIPNANWVYILGDVNYLIIATRSAQGATPARATTFGGLKAKYR
jgi:hypothetical protein